ncbi:MAG: glycosyltransferase family A protein [Patescibacteria group bacterium]|jgi:glycosyltransferase involved in cell wall biosynthesis
MISVIIPVYNQANKLIQTLRSLDQQTEQAFEVIIVNDGSSDGVEEKFSEYLKSLSQANLNQHHYLFINQSNQGAPAARNRGRQAAQGDFLFFCDADTILNKELLATLKQALLVNPAASYAYSSFYWGKKLFKLTPFSAERLRQEPYIHTMSLIRASDFPTQGWDESLKKFQDWDLWLTMLAEDKFGIFVDQVLFKVLPGGTISDWLPALAYRLLPFLPAVKKYQRAKEIIMKKHGISGN